MAILGEYHFIDVLLHFMLRNDESFEFAHVRVVEVHSLEKVFVEESSISFEVVESEK